MIDVESAGLTDIGRKRKGNEDSLFLDDNLKLYIVADGMGGHLAGEVASRLVVETMRDYMSRFEDNTAPELIDSDESLSLRANRLVSGIHVSNRVVYETSNLQSAYRGMGSTIAAVYFTDDTLIAGNVGDSPIYLIRDGKVETLSVPHTVLAEQLARNPNARLGREFSHMLTRAMGIEDTVKVDVCEIQCFKDDIIVLASDGLTDKLSPEEISEAVLKKRPEKACQILVDMANERGGDDNITTIVLKVKAIHQEKKGAMGWVLQMMNRLFKGLWKKHR